MPDVEQETDEAQFCRIEEILLDELRPYLPAVPCRLGITIARQVNKVHGVTLCPAVNAQKEFIKVDRLCLARLRGDARKLTDARERIDQRRFTDIGPPDEGNRGAALLRILISPHSRGKIDGLCNHDRFCQGRTPPSCIERPAAPRPYGRRERTPRRNARHREYPRYRARSPAEGQWSLGLHDRQRGSFP